MKNYTAKEFCEVVCRLAEEDRLVGVPERHESNSGDALFDRAGIASGFNGDARYLRSVYSAARWWAEHADKRGDK